MSEIASAQIIQGIESSGNGQRLYADLREKLERGLGADLRAMRVHTGPVADGLARALGAEAFTVGSEVFFRDGAFRPGTPEGLWLLAHEAAHVAQRARGAMAASPWTVSRPGDPSERDADCGAAMVMTGRTWRGLSGAGVSSTMIHRHVSFEHRMLGDGPTKNLVEVSTGGPSRKEFLINQIKLLELWRYDPGKVTETDIKKLCKWIRTVRLGANGLLVTYGELNALPDYLSDAAALDSLDADIVLPILQVIRQEGYNQLTYLLTGEDPNKTFAGAAAQPWKLSLVNNIVETSELDDFTMGLGPAGQDHYQGLLARNACHFAPYSWYRWQASHLIARDLATQAHAKKDQELARRAWIFHGYADHFLEDSFAAGHLVNKTLVMQWFIEWAASHDLFVSDWESIKDITESAQPSLSGKWLYDPAYAGPSNDPQTAQEASALVGRVLASTVAPYGKTGQFAAYQNYLTFLTSAAAQLSAADLHDHYNSHSLWVSSAARTTPYEIWGDDTLFSGANGGTGVAATSETAQMSQQALLDILASGTTSITTEEIRRHFPTKASSSSTGLQDLKTWMTTQKSFCMERFEGFSATLETLLLGLASPRLGVVSQDQDFASVWSRSLPDCGFHPVNMLVHDDRVFAACNGYVYELDPVTSKVVHSLHLTEALAGVATNMATDGTFLYAGVHGYAYGIRLNGDWSRADWSQGLGGTLTYEEVNVLSAGGKLFAGCDGYVYELRPATGDRIHSLHLTATGAGAVTRLAADGTSLYAGVHGYAYGIRLNGDWSRADWSQGLGGKFTYEEVNLLSANAKLFAGCDGYVYELRPATGDRIHSLHLTATGAGSLTRLAADGTSLYAGVHGYAYGIRQNGAWSKPDWSQGLGGKATYDKVSVLTAGGRLFAGCDGYVYQLNPDDGNVQHKLLLTYLVGIGDYDTRLAARGPNLYAGVNGYADKLLVNDVSPTGTLFHASGDSKGWRAWKPNFDGAPQRMQAVCGFSAGSGTTLTFAVGVDGTLYRDWLDKDGWHGWTPDFDKAAKMLDVAGVAGYFGLELFGIGLDGTLWHDHTQGGRWQGWKPDFDRAPKVQAVTVFGEQGTGYPQAFAIGIDGTLYYDRHDSGGWHGWTPNPGGIPVKVSAVYGASLTPSTADLFAIARDGTLYHGYRNAKGWQGWTPGFDGAPKLKAVTGAHTAPFSGEVFGIGLDGTLYRDHADRQGWHGWTPNFDGAPKARAVAGLAVADPAVDIRVFAITADGTLLHDYLDSAGTWHGWSPFGTNSPRASRLVYAQQGPFDTSEVFAISDA
ncbi:DUF4157 domain-containing protein [Actinomadura barringtoniae]|uniref:DUF4157 domain-containing protein n=1 Tax=Actinomadura barringtoniae TaxID=1427535 RepID=A0A939PJ54_9ACTN|nr:DUF4157 domain-containing protein [Actinomadura barringtoniae]MBO2453242.1 DUF4157 domain-containing protein [Actinomadura barringtoniae]